MNAAERAMPTSGPVLEQCYLCVMAPGGDLSSVEAPHDDLEAHHRAYLVDLEQRGVLFGAGPYVDFDGWGDRQEVGMMIIRADHQNQAEAIACEEPFTRAGVRTMRLIPWQRNGGTVQVSVRFANRELEIDGQPYRLESGVASDPINGDGGGSIVYACLMQTNPSPPEHGIPLDELRSGHQRYLKSLERDGALVASGPLRDETRRADDVGTGLIVLRADSRDAAERLIGEEPYAKSGARFATVAPWKRVMGSTTLVARLGSGELRVDARTFGLTSLK